MLAWPDHKHSLHYENNYKPTNQTQFHKTAVANRNSFFKYSQTKEAVANSSNLRRHSRKPSSILSISLSKPAISESFFSFSLETRSRVSSKSVICLSIESSSLSSFCTSTR
ncbi:hypothetical protein HanIR_Chr15g0731351 [Helianthus annuus]|nr:hypothetical protein HanIR_Chr15g0731351 [Helianthus annuus]